MFGTHTNFEIPFSAKRQALEPGTRCFRLVEHRLNVPLWYVRVLPHSVSEEDCPVWSQYLVTDAGDVMGLVLSRKWQAVHLHVLIPATYINGASAPILTTCVAMWECRALTDSSRRAWLFETEAGQFVDPSYGLEIPEVEKGQLYWKA